MYAGDTSPHVRSLQTGNLYDVIVVGARAAGAATAMLVARRGLRTLLLDRGALRSDTLSTHALLRGGVLQLARFGLLDEIVAAGTPPVKRTTFRYGDERIVISIKPSPGVDALYAPRRTLLDPLLVRAAADAGAHVYHRTTVTELIRRDGRVVGVHATTSDGRRVALGARLVIGADGIHSTIARRVGATPSRVGLHKTATSYAYWSGLETDGYEWIFRPNASAGVIPTNDGETCVFACATPERIGRGGLAVIDDIVTEAAPDLAARLRAAQPPRRAYTWRGQPGFMRQAHGPGWALVGDAGYYKDPISAHGLTDALRDAELLARAVVDGFGDDPSLREALDLYETTRDRLSVPLFDVVDRIASQHWTGEEIGRLLLQVSSATADEVELLAALEPDPALLGSVAS